MDVERARELLAAERNELERARGNRRHQDDSKIAGFQEPSNLAAELALEAFPTAERTVEEERALTERRTV